MKLLLSLFLLCVVTIEAGAELPPALKPLADKFESDRGALTAASEAQLKPVRERYLASLDAAEKKATAAARTADIAAIAAEIEGIGVGSLTEAFPPDLPRELAQDRRSYVSVVASDARALPARQRDLATQYLQKLAALDISAVRSKDPALTEAVATERARVLAFTEAAGGGQKNRNVVSNGDFSEGQPGSFPPGWKAEAADVNVTDPTIATEGADKFLRFRRLQALHRADLVPEKEINVPTKTKWVDFSARMRVKALTLGKDYDTTPGIHVTGRDARGEEAGGGWATTKQDTSWKRFSGRFELQPTARTLRVTIGPQGAAGLIDIDDVTVEFK